MRQSKVGDWMQEIKRIITDLQSHPGKLDKEQILTEADSYRKFKQQSTPIHPQICLRSYDFIRAIVEKNQ